MALLGEDLLILLDLLPSQVGKLRFHGPVEALDDLLLELVVLAQLL